MEFDFPLPAECWIRYRFPRAVLVRIGQEPPHHVELVIARPDLLLPLLARLLILGLNDLRVVLQDVGQPVAGDDARPEVFGFEAVRIRRVPGTIVPALVEWQEPRGFALEVRAEPHLVLIHGEMRHTAAELEELFARVAIALVLFHSVFDRLFGEAVLQLERGDRQAVDEQADVKRPLGLVAAVAELARDREAVLRIAFSSSGVAGRRRTVEEFDVMRPVLDPIAEHVDDTTLADLALQPSQELAPRRDPLRRAPAPRRPPAAWPSGMPRAGPDRHRTRGRSRWVRHRSSPLRLRREALPRRGLLSVDRKDDR